MGVRCAGLPIQLCRIGLFPPSSTRWRNSVLASSSSIPTIIRWTLSNWISSMVIWPMCMRFRMIVSWTNMNLSLPMMNRIRIWQPAISLSPRNIRTSSSSSLKRSGIQSRRRIIMAVWTSCNQPMMAWLHRIGRRYCS